MTEAGVDDVERTTTEVDHHLWRNRRTWWVAFTVLHDGSRQERVRRSLGTRDVEVARLKRDALIEAYRRRPNVEVSLRIQSSRRRATSVTDAMRATAQGVDLHFLTDCDPGDECDAMPAHDAPKS